MARVSDIYNYDGKYAPLRDPARRATASMQDAARGMDTLKEWVLVEMGLINTSNAIHLLAHAQPPRFDLVGDWLHQRHLIQEYPATAEYTKRPESLDEVFAEIIRMLDDIDAALKDFIRVSDELGLFALARQAETLQVTNSEDYEKWFYAWKMYDEADASPTSYDNWVLHLFENGGES